MNTMMPVVVLRLESAMWFRIHETIANLGCGIQSSEIDDDDWVTLHVTGASAEIIQRLIDRF